jgi:hypothetical protein
VRQTATSLPNFDIATHADLAVANSCGPSVREIRRLPLFPCQTFLAGSDLNHTGAQNVGSK